MKLTYKYLLPLLGVLLASAGPACAAPELAGIIRGVDTETQRLWIDERHYPFPAAGSIRNLDGGTDQAFDLAAGQHVRYSLTKTGELNELWVIPADSRKQDKLNLRGDTNH
ncbi:MAG: hypothetical protein WBO06_00790 [Gammaproteobacteria bacterium]